ncbi:MAG: hypothetical protein ACRCXB_29475 [Aeromonadaceae bacterium]
MNIVDLREDETRPHHWVASVDGVRLMVVTRDGQDPVEAIHEAMGEPVLTYTDKRVQEYPSIQDQLDMIYHDIDGWRDRIAEIKARHPKV